MNINEKEFIREIISSDFKHISNPDFTRVTIEKIAESEDRVTYSNSGDITFLIPVIIHVSLFILLSLISDIISWFHYGQIYNIMHLIDKISGFLVHPVTFSILFSSSLLYVIDLFLKKGSVYFVKPKMV